MLNKVMKVELVDLETQAVITLEKEDYDSFYYAIKTDPVANATRAVMEFRREFKAPFTLEAISLKTVGKTMQCNLYLEDTFVRSYKVSVQRYNVGTDASIVSENLICHVIEQL